MIPSDIDTASSMYVWRTEVFVVWIVVFGEQNILRMCLCLNWEPTESENPIAQFKIKNHLLLNEKTKLTFKFVPTSFKASSSFPYNICNAQILHLLFFSLKSVEVISKKTKSSVRIFVFTSAFAGWARIYMMCCVLSYFSPRISSNAKLSTDKKSEENFQFERICLFDFILFYYWFKLN